MNHNIDNSAMPGMSSDMNGASLCLLTVYLQNATHNEVTKWKWLLPSVRYRLARISRGIPKGILIVRLRFSNETANRVASFLKRREFVDEYLRMRSKLIAFTTEVGNWLTQENFAVLIATKRKNGSTKIWFDACLLQLLNKISQINRKFVITGCPWELYFFRQLLR